MNIQLNAEKIREILVTFYEVSHIRVVVYNTDYQIIAKYPEDRCRFCSQIKQYPELDRLCRQCDINGFERCNATNQIYIYPCHAGLTEAIVPLRYENMTVAYFMFGQITDIEDQDIFKKQIATFEAKHGISCDISDIRYVGRSKIDALTKLLEICAEYIIFKEMIRPQDDRVMECAKAYIQEHLSEPLSIDDVCLVCGCGRTKLYEMFLEKTGAGISKYILEKRMSLAEKLLTSTDLSVTEISQRCGFCDYNYFGKIFKKHHGVPPLRHRIQTREAAKRSNDVSNFNVTEKIQLS